MSFYDLFHKRRIEIAQEMLPCNPGLSLDIGSGTGFLPLIGYTDTIGLDILLWKGIKIRASAEYLPFRSQAFSLVFGGEVLEHLRRPAQALDEWVRVLEKKGTIGLSTPNGNLVRLEGNHPEHKRVFALEDLRLALARRGIRQVRHRTIFTGLKSGNRIFRLLPFSSVKRLLLRIRVPATLAYDLFVCGVKD